VDSKHPTLGLGSLSLHADRDLNETHAVAPPIFQASTFFADNAEEFLKSATEPRHPGFYTRYANPTHRQAEAVIAALEGTESALLLGSGMAAISTAVLTFVSKGDHIVAQKHHYAGTIGLLQDFMSRFGVELTLVDASRPDEFERAIRPSTKLILLETPTNPTMQITDLEAVTRVARAKGVVTAIDNTFATPVLQRPAKFGVDLVLHSATKYLGGHSDLILGAVAGPKALVEKVWKTSTILGATVNGFDSWLLLRGLRTLPIRVRAQSATALALSRFLSTHAKVAKVHYAGLETHPQHALARKQMSAFGGLLSFVLKGGQGSAEKLISSMKLPRRAGSLGGVETLVVDLMAMWAKVASPERMSSMGIDPGLVRMSVGLEEEADLLADLKQALDRL
jgi:cystathionine beta-lyase/cystathionine gamma-synthase